MLGREAGEGPSRGGEYRHWLGYQEQGGYFSGDQL